MSTRLDAADLSVIKDALIGRRHAVQALRTQTVFGSALTKALNVQMAAIDAAYDKITALEEKAHTRRKRPAARTGR